MTDLLVSSDARGVATLTLNRPARRNALDAALVTQIAETLHRLEADANVRILCVCGAGESFCAGADIEWLRRTADESEDANRADAEALARMMLRLDRFPKPTIAFVHGAAYGGGVGLVACCDIAIAADHASFCLSETRLGLIPAIIGPFVTRAIGARHARRLMLTAEKISAATARDIGLVHETASVDKATVLRERIIEALLRGAPGAQREAKCFISRCVDRPIDEALMRESAHMLAMLRLSDEGREGLGAFLEKRAPNWAAEGSICDVSQAADC